MSSLSDAHVSIARDPSLGDALERVVDAGQTLIVRRLDLLVEEFSAQAASLLASSGRVILGGALALLGWVIAVVGAIDVLDDYVARSAVEIAAGLIHVGVGVAIMKAWRGRTPGSME